MYEPKANERDFFWFYGIAHFVFFDCFIVHRYGLTCTCLVGTAPTDPVAITGDTKAGTFIGADRYGNKYFENMAEELPRKLNTTW